MSLLFFSSERGWPIMQRSNTSLADAAVVALLISRSAGINNMKPGGV